MMAARNGATTDKAIRVLNRVSALAVAVVELVELLSEGLLSSFLPFPIAPCAANGSVKAGFLSKFLSN